VRLSEVIVVVEVYDWFGCGIDHVLRMKQTCLDPQWRMHSIQVSKVEDGHCLGRVPIQILPLIHGLSESQD
jgi:hypothetical protein